MSCYYFDREFYRKSFVKKFRESLRHFCTCTMYRKQSLLKASSNNLHNETSGMYYKHMTIVNYASSFVNKLKTLHTDDARVVIYVSDKAKAKLKIKRQLVWFKIKCLLESNLRGFGN